MAQNEILRREGDRVWFGHYPQTLVGGHHARALRRRALPLPTPDNAYDWTDCGYYVNGKPVPYAWYIDLECAGVTYRGYYFVEYRPYSTDYYNNSREKSDQFTNGWFCKRVYWFRCDPIEWRVLRENAGEMLLLAESVLDSQPFNVDDKAANLYGLSSIRAWLNDHFLNTAFTPAEQRLLKARTVSVSGVKPQGYPDDWGKACGRVEVRDLVYLPDREDMLCPRYAEGNTDLRLGDMWRLSPTPYALAQGGWHMGLGFFDNPNPSVATWWLRTQCKYRHAACTIHDGTDDNFSPHYTGVGVLPTVCVRK